jgi:hypothetical protein
LGENRNAIVLQESGNRPGVVLIAVRDEDCLKRSRVVSDLAYGSDGIVEVAGMASIRQGQGFAAAADCPVHRLGGDEVDA